MIYGGQGPDSYLAGGPGHDTVNAGPGNDKIGMRPHDGRDVIYCGRGHDKVYYLRWRPADNRERTSASADEARSYVEHVMSEGSTDRSGAR